MADVGIGPPESKFWHEFDCITPDGETFYAELRDGDDLALDDRRPIDRGAATWSSYGADVATHVFIYDAAVGGELMAALPLDRSIELLPGDEITMQLHTGLPAPQILSSGAG